MPKTKMNGAEFNYETSGSGKDIVLLHGYVSDIEDWRNQVDYFSSRYRIAALDQRGRGKSGAPADSAAYSMDIFVDDVHQWLKLIGVAKCCLAGHSLGGMVAM